MTKWMTGLGLALALVAVPALAQHVANPPNEAGVTMGHWHMNSKDTEVNKKFFLALGGRCPVNASGGLIGGGHPVGATGARMLLDACRQVTGGAGAYQIEGAKRVATLNIGGSLGTVVSFVVGAG